MATHRTGSTIFLLAGATVWLSGCCAVCVPSHRISESRPAEAVCAVEGAEPLAAPVCDDPPPACLPAFPWPWCGWPHLRLPPLVPEPAEGVVPPHSKFHPVPTQPVFTPRPDEMVLPAGLAGPGPASAPAGPLDANFPESDWSNAEGPGQPQEPAPLPAPSSASPIDKPVDPPALDLPAPSNQPQGASWELEAPRLEAPRLRPSSPMLRFATEAPAAPLSPDEAWRPRRPGAVEP